MDKMVMCWVCLGEVLFDGVIVFQDDFDCFVFCGCGLYDYVCVECGNVLVMGMGLESMIKCVCVKCGCCCIVNVVVYDVKGEM